MDVMNGREPHQPEAASEYARNLRSTLEEAHERAREHLKTAQRRQRDYYDRRVAGEEIKVGDHVYLHVPVIKSGQTKKLHSPWHGPHVVVKKISDVTYRIEVDNCRKRRVVHFNRLKPCGEPRPRAQQPDQRDETDLMYADGTAADGNETLARAEEEDSTEAEVPASEPVAEVVPPPVVDRPRREVHAPAWMRDFVS